MTILKIETSAQVCSRSDKGKIPLPTLDQVRKELTISTGDRFLNRTNAMVFFGTTTIKKLQKTMRSMMISSLFLSLVLLTHVYAGTVPEKALQYATDGYYRKALAIIEPMMKEHSQVAEFQCRYGQALAGIGKFDEGIAALNTAISLDPNNGVYHRILGEAYGLKAQRSGGVFSVFSIFNAMKSAVAEFQLAAQLAPEDLKSHIFLAEYYIMAPGFLGGSFDKAHTEQKIIAKLDVVKGLHIRASEAIKKEDFSVGEKLLKEAASKDKTTESLMALGLFYTETKQYSEAFKTFREVKTKDPNAYGAWYQIGRVAGFAKTNYDEGIESLKHYIAFDDLPDNMFSLAWAHFRLGNIYEYQGNLDLARAEYQLANTLNESNEDLTSKLENALSRLD